MNFDETRTDSMTDSSLGPCLSEDHRRKRFDLQKLAAVAFITFAIGSILYSVYVYEVEPRFAMNLPEHRAVDLDRPPIELTGFQARDGGRLLTPNSVAVIDEVLYVSFSGQSFLFSYPTSLADKRKLDLTRPEPVTPSFVCAAGSLLVVSDSSAGLIAVYDRDGYYIASVSFYPDSLTRLAPIHTFANDDYLLLTDAAQRWIAEISLIDNPPFSGFLELTDLIRIDRALIGLPLMAGRAAGSHLWVGTSDPPAILRADADDHGLLEVDRPRLNRISQPVDFAVIQHFAPAGDAASRVHVLDRKAGKIFVYNLDGRLTLVYPRQRCLAYPTSFAVDSFNRRIFISESGTRHISVFGY
jgi:hypothetical protein